MSRWFRSLWLPAAVMGAFVLAGSVAPAEEKKSEEKKAPRPKVEVVFCLDTTGSMGGLIDGAKQKIWAICNQIAGGKPTPDLKVGLVAYRDRGDDYVTKVFDLTDDLDAIHGHLKGFSANGGGDAPESVNQALDDSVNKIKWSTDKKTLRIVFLVGDAPPHMDYKDDMKYPETCKKACEKGIIINTIQCGNDAECAKHWKEICLKAEGSYAQIAQDGGVARIDTPFDKELAAINTELARSTLAFGGRGEKDKGEAKARAAAALPAPAAADRAGFAAKSGRAATYDLLDAVKAKKVNLADLKADELPEEMKKMTPAERKEYLAKVEQKREELNKKALELDKKRSDFIQKKLAETKKGKDGFDEQVLQTLRKQAKKYDIAY
jgi:Mg-chelatase subunit ChlD